MKASISTLPECVHCGYDSLSEAANLPRIGSESIWVCPACSQCNTTCRTATAFCNRLGYHREIELEVHDGTLT
jgi:hypothetical protein